jgi:hypothetical protein
MEMNAMGMTNRVRSLKTLLIVFADVKYTRVTKIREWSVDPCPTLGQFGERCTMHKTD